MLLSRKHSLQWAQHLRQGLRPHFGRSASTTGQRGQPNLLTRHLHILHKLIVALNAQKSHTRKIASCLR